MLGSITRLVLDSFMPTYQQENCRDYRVSASRGARGTLRARLGLCSSLAGLALLCLGPHGAAAAAIEPGEVQVSTPVYQLPADVEWPDERWDYHFNWSGIPVGTLSIEAGGQPADDGDTDAGDSGKRLNVHVLGTTNSVVDLLWKYRLDGPAAAAMSPAC